MSLAGRLDRVQKRYGRQPALSDVSLEVSAGEVVGLIGPNGAGKTTALRILARLLRPDSGGVSIGSAGGAPEVRYFAGEHSLPTAVHGDRWLRMWSAGAAPTAPARPLGVLSRGTRQRVGLEAVLAGPAPALLLLDEPWEGLDPDASRWLSAEIVQRRGVGAGVVVSSHRIHDLADVCDRCVFLVAGRLAPESIGAADFAGVTDRSALLYAAFDRAKAAL